MATKQVRIGGDVWSGRPPEPGVPGWHKLAIPGRPGVAIAEWDAAMAQWFLPSLQLFSDRRVDAGTVAAEGWEYVERVPGHPHLGTMITVGSC